MCHEQKFVFIVHCRDIKELHIRVISLDACAEKMEGKPHKKVIKLRFLFTCYHHHSRPSQTLSNFSLLFTYFELSSQLQRKFHILTPSGSRELSLMVFQEFLFFQFNVATTRFLPFRIDKENVFLAKLFSLQRLMPHGFNFVSNESKLKLDRRFSPVVQQGHHRTSL